MTRRYFVLSVALLLVSGSASLSAPKRIPRTAVNSSSLASVGYDAVNAVLEVEFRSGAIYRYFGVSEELHREFMSAESKGRFFSQRIRDRYRFERINGVRP